jgi:tetratricopeptide (TPR) repeat protein
MGLYNKLRQAMKRRTGPGPSNSDLVRVFDKSGTPIHLTKETWRTSVLPGMLLTNWENSDELYKIIVGTLQDGLPADVAEAAEHLCQIDPNHSRAVCVWASALLGLKRIDEAEQVLLSHIDEYGEEGYVVTNLAKVYAERNQNDRVDAALWRALELDPDQEMTVGWLAALANERSGEAAKIETWKRIAALPGSWVAQLWLARNELESGHTPEALAFYRGILDRAGESTPISLLKQMSGDLGLHGLLHELLELNGAVFHHSGAWPGSREQSH